jgi:hypothetical protein
MGKQGLDVVVINRDTCAVAAKLKRNFGKRLRHNIVLITPEELLSPSFRNPSSFRAHLTIRSPMKFTRAWRGIPLTVPWSCFPRGRTRCRGVCRDFNLAWPLRRGFPSSATSFGTGIDEGSGSGYQLASPLGGSRHDERPVGVGGFGEVSGAAEGGIGWRVWRVEGSANGTHEERLADTEGSSPSALTGSLGRTRCAEGRRLIFVVGFLALSRIWVRFRVLSSTVVILISNTSFLDCLEVSDSGTWK